MPSLTRIYPNGSADVNAFTAAGGTGFLIRELVGAGLLHPDARTVSGAPLADYEQEPWLDGETLRWRSSPQDSRDETVLRPRGAAIRC